MKSSKKHLVVLTGAGISAESGIATFRDSGGLWEGYDVMKVATPEGWNKDYKMVLDFYNQRRENVRNAKPNPAHLGLVEFEKNYDVSIITQNIDDLHERAGSKQVLHLHGEIMKARSSVDDSILYDLGEKNIHPGDKCEKGAQLRPHVVWFGEAVPMMENAVNIASKADILLIVGTSMVVYPAAGLINYVKPGIPKYVIDPNLPEYENYPDVVYKKMTAVQGVREMLSLKF